jgi:hypothetical protein
MQEGSAYDYFMAVESGIRFVKLNFPAYILAFMKLR